LDQAFAKTNHVSIKDVNIKKSSIKHYVCSYYFHSHIFPPELPFSSTSYSNTPTRLLRKASLPVVDGGDAIDG